MSSAGTKTPSPPSTINLLTWASKAMSNLNLPLAAKLAIRNLSQHRIVSGTTILGVAIGMIVVGAILIVDNNTAHTPDQRSLLARSVSRSSERNASPSALKPLATFSIAFLRRGEPAKQSDSFIPTQERKGEGQTAGTDPSRPGVEDYQTMRLAVRLASLLAFSIGAVIVFYTMRFSVASRSRALSLLLCLGEFRSNIGLSLMVESLALGFAGTVLGMFMSLPLAGYLILRGISTTGQVPMPGLAIPWLELVLMAAISIVISLLGIAGPV